MADFGIRFFLCNIFICVIISLFLIIKHALRNHLTRRLQFNLWFLLLLFLLVPFIPFHPIEFTQIFLWLGSLKNAFSSNINVLAQTPMNMNMSDTLKQVSDFAVSVSSNTPSPVGLILCVIWLIGIMVMLLLVIKSRVRLVTLKKSALPLQNSDVRILYNKCLNEMRIKRNIPIYSTAFLKSPIILGLFRPCIYLPIHLISDFNANIEGQSETLEGCFNDNIDGQIGILEGSFNAADIRYMLLHELQHYKHKDALASYLMNFIGILYWFNPLVWYALREMRDDREVACDTSVLKLLNENEYENYGSTLINFAEKISLAPFPFAAGISGSMKQMKKRIINISTYKKPSIGKKIKGLTAFAVIAVTLLGLTPMLSTYAAEQNHYKWSISPEKVTLLSSNDINEYPEGVSVIDISVYFNGYEGSFVLYELKGDTWSIYDMERATLRTSPNSTYKIYSALLGLEKGIITPDDSFMEWDGANYPFEAWNANQNLCSAMKSSVNWYFQKIDEQLGASVIKNYVRRIGYGNESINSDLSSYWMQSSLKISPIEQVELLANLYNNSFGFAPENINAVKTSICLFSDENSSSEEKGFYGKTGTGRIDGQDVNGWFVGYVETSGNTYFFATNIQSTQNATGSKASEISLSILSDMGIWEQ